MASLVGKRFTYEHPERLGLGAHHADPGDPPMPDRLAQPPEEMERLRGAVAAMGLGEEAMAKVDAFVSRTMADLDLHHGTEVTVYADDDGRGLLLVEWADQHGDARLTSIAPDVFAANFAPAGG
jgi:hypothetical protein